jgi:hypothetical protein
MYTCSRCDCLGIAIAVSPCHFWGISGRQFSLFPAITVITTDVILMVWFFGSGEIPNEQF